MNIYIYIYIYVCIFKWLVWNDWLFWECNCGRNNNLIMNMTNHLNWSSGIVRFDVHFLQRINYYKIHEMIFINLLFVANGVANFGSVCESLETIMWQLIDVMSSLYLITFSVNNSVFSSPKNKKSVKREIKKLQRDKKLLLLHNHTHSAVFVYYNCKCCWCFRSVNKF